MASATLTRSRATRNHKGGAVRGYASELNRAQDYVDGMTGRVRRGYRKTKNMIRRHPGTSAAILLAGVGVVAGVVAGIAFSSRFRSRRLIIPPPEAIAEFFAGWHR